MERSNNINHEKVFRGLPSLYLLLLPDAPVFTIIDASDAYLSATLRTRDEIVNKGIFIVFPDNPNDPAANGTRNLSRSLLRVIEKKKTDVMPLQKYDIPIPPVIGSGFEERFWHPKNTPVLNEDGTVCYIVHTAEDVTRQVRLQRERESEAKTAAREIEEKSTFIKKNQARINHILNSLLKYTALDFSERIEMTENGDELDAIVVGLNSLIDELQYRMEQLKSLNTELKEANHELDSFSYSVSHDLRAPLRAIIGYSQVLVEDYAHALDENGKSTVEVIARNAQRMALLIDDLLTFSHVGKRDLKKTHLCMNDIVAVVIEELNNANKNNVCEFIFNTLHDAEGDGSMVKQVVTNLISNSLKYSSKKERPVIEIGSYLQEEMVVFYVKDNGVGFNMKYYDKLFGVFQRLHSHTEFEGTGVGLALVQRIIKKHNGKVWAEGTPDVGATFSFSLPKIRN